MKRSELIQDLAAALAKAQSEIKAAKKDTENTFFGSQYADLASVWTACREPITKNGLSVTQTIGLSENKLILETMLLHVSGQWIQSDIPLILPKQDMQGLGAATTYARRFALAAIVGIAQDDDDGNSVQAEKPKVNSKVKLPAPVVQGAAKPVVGTSVSGASPSPVTPKPQSQELKPDGAEELKALASKCGWKGHEVVAYMRHKFQKAMVSALTLDQFQDLETIIQRCTFPQAMGLPKPQEFPREPEYQEEPPYNPSFDQEPGSAG